MDKTNKENEDSAIKIDIKENDSLFIELSEVKKMLSLGTSVYNFVRDQNIPYLRAGSKYKIHRKSFYKWIEKSLIYNENVISYDISNVQKLFEVIQVNNDDIFLIYTDNLEKVLELYVRKDTVFKVKSDNNIKKILDQYKNLNYRIIIRESSEKSKDTFLDKEIKNEFKKLYG
jgi:uncharacterized UBP type Zn finger protein